MRHLPALLLVALHLLPAAARAQWIQTNGPGRAPSLLVHSDGVRIQVGLDQQGVYLSTNQGASWVPSTGLEGATVTCFAQNASFLFAGLQDNGTPGRVYRSSNGGIETESIGAMAIAGPNPVRGHTTIEFRLPESAPILLRLIDVAGRTMGRLASGTWPAGVHRVDWVAGDLPAGSYWLELATPRDRRAAKLLLVK